MAESKDQSREPFQSETPTPPLFRNYASTASFLLLRFYCYFATQTPQPLLVISWEDKGGISQRPEMGFTPLLPLGCCYRRQ